MLEIDLSRTGGSGSALVLQEVWGLRHEARIPASLVQMLVAEVPLNLTIQWAAVKTSTNDPTWLDLPYTLSFNGDHIETYTIRSNLSTSCGVRSSVSCLNFRHQFIFDAGKLMETGNEFVLSLPYNASSIETAAVGLPWTTYVQYDALRFELI